MNDKNIYLYDYLTSKAQALDFPICKILSSKKHNKEKVSSEVLYAISYVLESLRDVESLILKLDIKYIDINLYFNKLSLLFGKGYPDVDKFLKKYNYLKTQLESYTSIMNKIKAFEELDKSEKLFVDFLINYNYYKKNDIRIIAEYYIKNILIKNRNISYSTFERLIVSYVKVLASGVVSGAKCELFHYDPVQNITGYSDKEIIYLTYEEISDMYFEGKYNFLLTMFHETGHLKQYKRNVLEESNSPSSILQIKEDIITQLRPDYYVENHNKISSEIEANIFAMENIVKFFKHLGLSFKKGNNNPYESKIKLLKQLAEDKNRQIDGLTLTVDEIFNDIIYQYPEYLDIYPQLKGRKND